jgi:CO/xanthine dehydrogenase Mo-binding subunit/aerobic-type carbon monoxide dehydrogenase small subunit (CoxS/CutS family)
MGELINFVLNGQPVAIVVDPARPLLNVLRDDLGLTGVKQSCDMEGECGACTVIVDGEAQRSCLLLAGEIAGRAVTTVEGLGTPEQPHPLQTAFLEAGAVQCGYCTPGMLLSAKALLDRTPHPTRNEITTALAGNICRCTGYTRIIAAVERAAEILAPPESASSPCHPVTVSPPCALGGDLTRHDGWGRVSGATRYAGDITRPDMHHVAFVRSPHFHAQILSLDPAPALALPGVVKVLTAADVPGENIGLGGYSQDEHLLAPVGGKVRMLGDPIALVIGRTPEAAAAGAEAVRVEFAVLPHTFDVAGATAPDAIRIHEDNLLATAEAHTGDAAAALAGSDVVVSATYRTTFQAHMAMERESAVAYWAEDDLLTVICGSHEPHWNRAYLATILGLPVERIRVINPPMGGSFGGRQDVYPMAAAALAAYHLRQPVKLVYSRREVMDAAPKRHPYTLRGTVGGRRETADERRTTNDGRRTTDDGRRRTGVLTGLQLEIEANTGAYDSAGRYIADYAVVASVGPYRWQGVDVQAKVLYSNGPKAGQFRGFGTPQSVFATECLLDELCQQLDADPLAFRLHNLLADGDHTGTGLPIGETLGIRPVLEALEGDYREMTARVTAFNADGGRGPRRRGVGLAAMMYRFGKYGAARSQAEAELGLDGGITVYASATEFGQGIETVFTQLAAETLGIARAGIRLVNADTARTLDGDVTGASRAAYWVGSAVVDAARRLAAAIRATAAELLDRPPDDLILSEDAVHSRSTLDLALPLAAVAAEMTRTGQPRRIRGALDLSRHYPDDRAGDYLPFFLTAAHLAEVEVDLETGKPAVKLIVAAHDVGKVINPRDAAGQVEGGVVMGLGSALSEEFTPGVSRGFSTYAVPTATSVPEIRVRLVETPGRHAAFGVKGLGEATFLPTPPAIINAISRAIGARIRQTPATAERIRTAIT